MESKHVPSRPTTPLRPSSRTSMRSNTSFNPYASAGDYGQHLSGESQHEHQQRMYGGPNPLASLEPAFAELADSFADLEANMMHLQLLHESVSRFSENFAAFLYGMNVNAFCVDFPEAPVAESFRRVKATAAEDGDGSSERPGADVDPDMTIVSTATSFVDHPVGDSGSKGARYAGARGATGAGRAGSGAGTRGRAGAAAAGAGRGRAASRGSTGASAGRGRASGIARGTARSRGMG